MSATPSQQTQLCEVEEALEHVAVACDDQNEHDDGRPFQDSDVEMGARFFDDLLQDFDLRGKVLECR